ncbi:hypothetical protein ACFO0R_02500 [Chromobacterium aquaticum]|uniref:CCHC-type domain-containing protein n=2 Tax=Chromobacterium aquaticum TaxID=467180 RepID=A0ABV8ZQS6_9NEIS
MPCSICGKDGHNAKTCNEKQHPTVGDTHALWVKFDKITGKEASELLKAIIDIKEEIAPHARGTFAKGAKKEMPQKIAEALRLSENNTADDEPKKIE